VPPGPPSEARAVATTATGLLLIALVGLASGGSPWQAGGGQALPVAVVGALAAAAGALVTGALLLAWVGTPPPERRRRRRRRLGVRDLDELGASLSAAARAALVVGGVVGVLLLLAVPLLTTDASTPTRVPPASAPSPGQAGSPGPAAHTTSTALPWVVVGSVSALLLLAPAAIVVRRRRAQRDRQAVVPEVSRIVSDLRRSLATLESERDPRRAVQQAYACMEESLGAIELSRAPAETPTEFTARVLRVLGASAAAAAELTGLFEIARFSDHPLGEEDRLRAIAAVRRVEAEVSAP
jgi:hypothetical protein